jgi:glycosyltransferase involved in cell wall biosynthesis
MDSTAAALSGLGHDVERVECSAPDRRLDVLHAFHAEPAVWQFAPHWSRNRCPLVVSPVLPIRPGRDARLLWISARVPGLVTTARMRREVISQADAVVAQSEYERDVTRRVFGADPARTQVIGNAVERVDADGASLPAGVPDRDFLLMVGGVSHRKQQVEVARAVAHRAPLVVVGGLVGDARERAELERDLVASGAIWLGEIRDERVVRALQRSAAALVLLSVAEAQPLVLLEALSVATPVIASDLPAHRELRARHPGWVALVQGPEEVLGAANQLAARGVPREPPEVDTWTDVAERLVAVYEGVARDWPGEPRG